MIFKRQKRGKPLGRGGGGGDDKANDEKMTNYKQECGRKDG